VAVDFPVWPYRERRKQETMETMRLALQQACVVAE
jgi:hypothetical protein